ANPKLVVRFQPDASKLWRLIEDGDMPPDEAKAGPLNDSEKQLIHVWVEAGAPAPLTAAGAAPTAAPLPDLPDAPAPPVVARVLRLLGKLHVPAVHFPIALLAAAAAAESWRIWKGRLGTSTVVRFCVLLGAAGAVVAGALGWI